MKGLLHATRERLGPAPRVVAARDVRSAPPSWMGTRDKLYSTYSHTDLLLETGDVVWGHIVQANSLLFSPGDLDCPADVIFAEDRSFDHDLHLLARTAHDAFELKSGKQVDGAYRRVAEHLASEHEREWRLPVPDGLSHGRTLAIATIMIHRRLLPLPYLGASFLPLVVSPRVPTVIVLPAVLWAEDLVQAWRDVAAEPSD